LFDFGFPTLAAGQTFSFKTFYGGAATETAAENAIGAVGAEVYSFGQPSTPDGPTLGTPNTFIFAFAGVGGEPQVPQVSLGAPTATVNEGAGEIVLPVNLNTEATEPVTVEATTSDGSATAPGDYGAVDTTVTIPAGQSSGSVTVPIVDDTDDESDETFTVQLSDPTGAVLGDPASTTVTITDNDEPTGENQPPVASNQSVTTPQDTAKAITLQATDPDGDTLTYEIVDEPDHGTLTGTGADRTYTPDAGYTGPDSFTFRANDGQVDSNTATVDITVTPVAEKVWARGFGKVVDKKGHHFHLFKFAFRARIQSDGDLVGRAVERTPHGWFVGRELTSLTVVDDTATAVYSGKFRGRTGYTLTITAVDAPRDRVTLVISKGGKVVSSVSGRVLKGGVKVSG
jgi:hypothetical protein